MKPALNTTIVLFAISTAACADTSADVSDALQIRSLAAGSCTQHGNNNEAFPVGADSVVVRLTGAGLDEAFVERIAKDGDGPYVLTGIPPAEDLTMDIVACSGTTALAAGRTEGIDVLEHQKTFPPVFLTPMGGQTACLGTDLDKATASHAFGASAKHGDRMYVLGGLGDYTLAQSEGAAKGTDAVTVYNRLDGSRETLPLRLTSPRAMATVLKDGPDVWLIGGASTLKLNAPNFDLWPGHDTAPSCGIERVNLDNETSTCEYEESLPSGGSGTQISATSAVYVGGLEPNGDMGSPSDKVFVVEAGTVTELTMPNPRVGANVTRLSDSEALIWGGGFDVDVSTNALLVNVVEKSFAVLTVAGDSAAVTMLGSVTYMGMADSGDYQVLVAGGTAIKKNGDVVSAPIPPVEARLQRLTITTDGLTVENVGGEEDAGELMLAKRVAATLVKTGQDEFWLVGGVTSYSPDASVCPGQSDCFPAAMFRFTVTGTTAEFAPLGDAVLEMSVGPLGAVITDLGDESWLVTGGLQSAGTDALDEQAELVRFESTASNLCSVTMP